jgi:hypothetical protein
MRSFINFWLNEIRDQPLLTRIKYNIKLHMSVEQFKFFIWVPELSVVNRPSIPNFCVARFPTFLSERGHGSMDKKWLGRSMLVFTVRGAEEELESYSSYYLLNSLSSNSLKVESKGGKFVSIMKLRKYLFEKNNTHLSYQ